MMGLEHELYYKPWVLFYSMQTIGLTLFIVGMSYKFFIYFQGKRNSFYNEPKYWPMLKAFIGEVIFQRQILRKSFFRWSIHLMIFIGFLGLIKLSAIAVFLKIIPETSLVWQFMVSGNGYYYYKFAGDLFGLMMLIGLALAFVRRYLFRDQQLHSDFGDNVSLLLLFILVITGFLLEAMRISLAVEAPMLKASFVGYLLAELFKGREGVAALATNMWVFHAGLNALFFAYLPHGKFIHAINAPVEIVINASEEHQRGDLYL